MKTVKSHSGFATPTHRDSTSGDVSTRIHAAESPPTAGKMHGGKNKEGFFKHLFGRNTIVPLPAGGKTMPWYSKNVQNQRAETLFGGKGTKGTFEALKPKHATIDSAYGKNTRVASLPISGEADIVNANAPLDPRYVAGTRQLEKLLQTTEVADDRIVGRNKQGMMAADGKLLVWNNDEGAWHDAPPGLGHVERLRLGASGLAFAMDDQKWLRRLDEAGKQVGMAIQLPQTAHDFAVSFKGSVAILDNKTHPGQIGYLDHSKLEAYANGKAEIVWKDISVDEPPAKSSVARSFTSIAFGADGKLRALDKEGNIFEGTRDKPEDVKNTAWTWEPVPSEVKNASGSKLVKLCTWTDGTVLAVDQYKNFMVPHMDGSWMPLRHDAPNVMQAFFAQFRTASDTRWRAVGLGTPLLPFGNENVRQDKPWYKPGIFHRNYKGERLRSRWANHWCCHHQPKWKKRKGEFSGMAEELGKELRKDWEDVRQFNAGELPELKGAKFSVNSILKDDPEFAELHQHLKNNSLFILDDLEKALGTRRYRPDLKGEEISLVEVAHNEYRKSHAYRGVCGVSTDISSPDPRVQIKDNVLWSLYQLYGEGSDDPVAKRLKALLDKNVFLAADSEPYRVGMGKSSRNKYGVLTGKLVHDHAILLQAIKVKHEASSTDDSEKIGVDKGNDLEEIATENGENVDNEKVESEKTETPPTRTVSDFAELLNGDGKGSYNHITQLCEDGFKNIDRVYRFLDVFNHWAEGFTTPGHRDQRAMTGEGTLGEGKLSPEDVAELYSKILLQCLEPGETITLSSGHGGGIDMEGDSQFMKLLPDVVKKILSPFLNVQVFGIEPVNAFSMQRTFKVSFSRTEDGGLTISFAKKTGGEATPIATKLQHGMGGSVTLGNVVLFCYIGFNHKWKIGFTRAVENSSTYTIPQGDHGDLQEFMKKMLTGKLDPFNMMAQSTQSQNTRSNEKSIFFTMDAEPLLATGAVYLDHPQHGRPERLTPDQEKIILAPFVGQFNVRWDKAVMDTSSENKGKNPQTPGDAEVTPLPESRPDSPVSEKGTPFFPEIATISARQGKDNKKIASFSAPTAKTVSHNIDGGFNLGVTAISVIELQLGSQANTFVKDENGNNQLRNGQPYYQDQQKAPVWIKVWQKRLWSKKITTDGYAIEFDQKNNVKSLKVNATRKAYPKDHNWLRRQVLPQKDPYTDKYVKPLKPLFDSLSKEDREILARDHEKLKELGLPIHYQMEMKPEMLDQVKNYIDKEGIYHKDDTRLKKFILKLAKNPENLRIIGIGTDETHAYNTGTSEGLTLFRHQSGAANALTTPLGAIPIIYGPDGGPPTLGVATGRKLTEKYKAPDFKQVERTLRDNDIDFFRLVNNSLSSEKRFQMASAMDDIMKDLRRGRIVPAGLPMEVTQGMWAQGAREMHADEEYVLREFFPDGSGGIDFNTLSRLLDDPLQLNRFQNNLREAAGIGKPEKMRDGERRANELRRTSLMHEVVMQQQMGELGELEKGGSEYTAMVQDIKKDIEHDMRRAADAIVAQSVTQHCVDTLVSAGVEHDRAEQIAGKGLAKTLTKEGLVRDEKDDKDAMAAEIAAIVKRRLLGNKGEYKAGMETLIDKVTGDLSSGGTTGTDARKVFLNALKVPSGLNAYFPMLEETEKLEDKKSLMNLLDALYARKVTEETKVDAGISSGAALKRMDSFVDEIAQEIAEKMTTIKLFEAIAHPNKTRKRIKKELKVGTKDDLGSIVKKIEMKDMMKSAVNHGLNKALRETGVAHAEEAKTLVYKTDDQGETWANKLYADMRQLYDGHKAIVEAVGDAKADARKIAIPIIKEFCIEAFIDAGVSEAEAEERVTDKMVETLLGNESLIGEHSVQELLNCGTPKEVAGSIFNLKLVDALIKPGQLGRQLASSLVSPKRTDDWEREVHEQEGEQTECIRVLAGAALAEVVATHNEKIAKEFEGKSDNDKEKFRKESTEVANALVDMLEESGLVYALDRQRELEQALAKP